MQSWPKYFCLFNYSWWKVCPRLPFNLAQWSFSKSYFYLIACSYSCLIMKCYRHTFFWDLFGHFSFKCLFLHSSCHLETPKRNQVSNGTIALTSRKLLCNCQYRLRRALCYFTPSDCLSWRKFVEYHFYQTSCIVFSVAFSCCPDRRCELCFCLQTLEEFLLSFHFAELTFIPSKSWCEWISCLKQSTRNLFAINLVIGFDANFEAVFWCQN